MTSKVEDEPTLAESSPDDSPPKDRFFIVYIASIVVLGATDYPWKSLSAGIDYFQYLYPDFQPEIAFFLVVNLMLLLSSLFTISTVHLLPVFGRLVFTSVVFICPLLFIPLLDIGIHNCTVDITVAFGLTLIAVSCIGIASGILQSSLYGLSGMLPPRYTQASSVGYSLASILSCLVRIITKLSFKEEHFGAITFLVIGVIMILLGIVCQVILRFSKFVQYYMKKAAAATDIVRLKNDEIAESSLEQDNEVAAINEIELTTLSTSCEIDNNDGTLLAADDDGIIKFENKTRIARLKKQLKWRLVVFKKTWRLSLTVFLVYLVTHVLRPSLLSEVQYCSIGDWTPLLLLSCFSVFDITGRYVVFLPINWKQNWLLIASVCRLILIPLILLSLVPSPTFPILPTSAALWIDLVLTGILGFTHGYFATKSITTGSILVESEHKELTGNMMTFFILLGPFIGSAIAYALHPLTRLKEYTPCLENYTATFICQL